MPSHWLAAQIDRLLGLAPDEGSGAGAEARARRREFLAAIAEVVDAAAHHEGVTSAFASYEGLVVAASGAVTEVEGLAAMAQSAMEPARHTAGTIELGNLRQLLIVGERRKLALIRVGPVTLGLLSPSEVHLAESLAR